jgi:hypothetical protein
MITPLFVLIQSISLCAPLPTPQAPAPTKPVYALSEFGCDYALPGTFSGSAAFGANERAQLCAAEHQAPELAALRAGDGPSNQEWGWIAIGALVVLLIVVL